MLFDLFRVIKSGGGFWPALFMLGTFALLIFVVLPFHEFAHAYVANKLGDNTPKWQRRLTLNPMAHLDPIGTLMMLICGFGYAKPVPVNAANFEKPKKGMALVALAGPLSNLLLAFLAVAAFRSRAAIRRRGRNAGTRLRTASSVGAESRTGRTVPASC